MFGGKNSFFRKPLGTGSGSFAQMIGSESPDVAMPELSQADKTRQEGLAKAIEGDISGTNESLAVKQYEKAQEDAIKAAMAMSASTKGVSNPALLARNVAQASDNQQQELAQDSAIMRGQERQAAMGMMNQYLAAQQGVALNNANIQNQSTQSTLNRQAGMLGAAGSAGATLAAASDENLKENVKPSSGKANKMVEDFVDALDSYTFDYKDEKHGQGNKVGVMAQDLEKSDLGKQMVKDTPEGKMVDFGQGFAAILAAQAELKDEMDKIKKKKAS